MQHNGGMKQVLLSSHVRENKVHKLWTPVKEHFYGNIKQWVIASKLQLEAMLKESKLLNRYLKCKITGAHRGNKGFCFVFVLLLLFFFFTPPTWLRKFWGFVLFCFLVFCLFLPPTEPIKNNRSINVAPKPGLEWQGKTSVELHCLLGGGRSKRASGQRSIPQRC